MGLHTWWLGCGVVVTAFIAGVAVADGEGEGEPSPHLGQYGYFEVYCPFLLQEDSDYFSSPTGSGEFGAGPQ